VEGVSLFLGAACAMGWSIPSLAAGCKGLGRVTNKIHAGKAVPNRDARVRPSTTGSVVGPIRLLMPRAVVLSLLLLAGGCSHPAPLPAAAVVHNNAAVVALASGDLERADHHLSLALEYAPEFAEGLVNLGLVEMQRGNFVRARMLLERARRLHPDIAEPHHGLGVLCEREGALADAESSYRAALGVDPGFAPSREALGRLYFNSGMLDQARVEFGRLLASAPGDPSAAAGLAQTLMSLGRDQDASQTLSEIPAGRDTPALLLARARLLLRTGATDDAESGLSAGPVGPSPLEGPRLAWLAVIYLARDNRAQAMAMAEQALALDPGDPLAQWVLAQTASPRSPPFR
jgi:tetratricopeptide (TPR) repeat protein